MTCRFVESVDHYVAQADILRKWTAAGATGTYAVMAGAGRFGGNALRIDPLGCYLQKTIDNQSTWVVGFALNPPGLPTAPGSAVLCQLVDGANGVQCDLRVNSDGTLAITRNGTAVTGGQSVATLRVGAWNYVEFKVTIATSILANTAQIQLNGAVVATVATGQSLQSTANTTANQVLLAGAYVGCLFDDIYVCDGNGTTNNTFLGDVRVVALLPNGAGATTQFSVTGAPTNWQAVADSPGPDGDTTYVSSATPGQVDLYTLGALSVTGTIKAVQTVLDLRKDDAGTRQAAALVRPAGSTNYQGATVNLGASYLFATEVRETNPATGVAWTTSDINTPLQIGMTLVA